MTVAPPVLSRPAARVLVLDPAGRVLLLCHGDKGRAWITPGGAVEPGESLPAAAARELAEETGIRADPAEVVGPVLRERVLWSPSPGQWYDGDDTFFVLRTSRTEVDPAGRSALERAILTGDRWWSVDELRSTRETVFPESLGELVSALADDWVDAVAVDRSVQRSGQ